jgi:acyl-CoA thioesterase-1
MIKLKNWGHHLFLSIGAFILALGIGMNSSIAATILVLGDSLSAGYGMAVEEGWVSLWQQQLTQAGTGHRIVNASISGETSSGGLSRLPTLLAQHQPHCVVIELGANDALRGQDLKRLEHNLSQMIEQAKAQQAQVLLLGIRLPTNYGDAFNQRLLDIYAKLAQQHQILLDPFFLADLVTLPNALQTDGLHPSAAVQAVIMQRVAKQLSSVCVPF